MSTVSTPAGTTDTAFMRRAIELSEFGRGWTSPGPMAGAVVVKDGEVVGEGFYQGGGSPHAEPCALGAAAERAQGATLYVTIEPCFSRTRESCISRIAESGVARVVIGAEDPNPVAAGKGVAALRERGVEVHVGVEEQVIRRGNEASYKFLATRRPFVALFGTMSFDGRVATSIGEKPEAPRSAVDLLRASHDAVLVGVSTVVQDDPEITTHLERARNPLCIVVDGMARTPVSARILGNKGAGARPQALVVTTRFAPDDKLRELKAAGAEVLVAPEEGDPLAANIDLNRLLTLLGKREVASVLIEGGGTLSDAALAAGLIDKIYLYVHPAILGGASAPGLVGGLGASFVEEAPAVSRLGCRPCGEGLLLEGYLGAT
ncbi:MAG: bifunctional diaminohydroxyphosphoribosylaminopyrimidine deaminase/5-amino-6-(5-phosphoribosylamino)uracil reductase RibD [Candidatus Sericytochromatia bacterium]|nr:bifunctional diaminohydroxyphosphoribosylaminopyrimidine deaminase/5-amino-6-(5-phosphoribosylamino)uracil reductase RibD [Candidatus Tanganyikabacteria bacterium]